MDKAQADHIDTITERVNALLNGSLPDIIDTDGYPQDEIWQLSNFINRLIHQMQALFDTTRALAEGSLELRIDSSLPPAGALKSLQAALKHLTWQTERVAAGDFSQRVAYLGQFSTAFNQMVQELAANRERLMAQQEELSRLATTDPLTGIYNRRRFFDLARQELARAQRFKLPLSVLQMDLDHFKRINDTYGHAMGDEIIKTSAKITLDALREQDIFGRLGGEEFSAVIIQTARQDAHLIADRIRCRIADIAIPANAHPPARITASIGIAEVCDHDRCFEDLLHRADLMLYEAKRNGRNRVVVCDKSAHIA